jgi:eukaryotic-like serine/threonine-protein kinase
MPSQLGKYTLIRKLATGGMAELFVAVQSGAFGFEKLVVIKRILPALTGDRALVEMLLHEARTLATLSHPNIVQIFDVGLVDDNYFIAMEHVHGEDLRSIVRQMKAQDIHEFPIEHALSVVLGVCAGLAYAHDRRAVLDGTPLNIVHCDISPQNVIIAHAGEVKIVDFGIAQSDAMSREHTKSGRLKGKIPYMSPEQAHGGIVDRRSDIFAAGVILFELTTGRRLFKGTSEYETIELICDRDYPRPSDVRGDYPPELEAIVMRALAKDREERWQTAREMQSALEDFARRERVPVSAIALSQFMHSLFADKIAKAELAQSSPKADVVPAEHRSDAAALTGRASSISPTATARTVTEVGVASRGTLVLGLGALAGLVVAGQVLWWTRQPAPPLPVAPAAAVHIGTDGGAGWADSGVLK